VYEPGGRVAARSAIVDHSASSQANPCGAVAVGPSGASKQLRVPR
jgi:hypothetical protein